MTETVPAITLIYVSFDKPLKNPYGEKIVYHPLGISYLSSFIHSYGIQVRSFNHHFMNQSGNDSYEKNLMNILRESSDWVGFSCTSSSLPPLLLFLEEAKARFPEKTFVLGGSAVNQFPGQLMERFPWIDFIIRGEGEYPLVELLKGYDYAFIDGLVYRDNGEIYANRLPGRIKDLDALPYPDYSFFDYTKLNSGDIRFDGFYLLSSRGCAHRCTFCDIHNQWSDKVVFRSIADVVQEIKLIVEHTQCPFFKIVDDNFLLKKNRVIRFCEMLKEEQLEIYWGCSSTVRDIDESMMKTLKENNCIKLFLGVESTSDRILKTIGKKHTYQEAREKILRAREYFQVVTASFIWGFPFENYDEFEEFASEMLILRSLNIGVQTHLLNPMPNTQIFKQFNSMLRFRREIQSDIVGWPVYKDDSRLISFIETNRDVFPFFCYYYTDDFDKKHKAISRKAIIKGI